LAFVNPLRVTQLHARDAALVTDFSNRDPYTQAQPLPPFLVEEILSAILGQTDRIVAHALLEPTRFDTLTWLVCAPSPRPENADLAFSYRFTLRTGVTLRATARDETGCLELTAEMGPGYVPPVPTRRDEEWSWAEMSQEATAEAGIQIDIRQRILASRWGLRGLAHRSHDRRGRPALPVLRTGSGVLASALGMGLRPPPATSTRRRSAR
jgi:hypothetical protein